ncbi:MAG TPA: sugar phosphate isomerase/epimerase family protein [Steroidobacteraceae bacterium]
MPNSESPVIALCWGTLIGTPLEPLIAAAGHPDIGAITLTSPMYEAARRSGGSVAGLRRRLEDNGLSVHAIDPLIGALPGTPKPADVPTENRAYFEITEDDCYRAAADLQAETINLAHFGGSDVTEAQFVDCLGPLAGRAQAHGVRLTLEFLPESSIPDLATAQRIVSAVGAPNLGLMFDTWHFARSGGTLAQLAALPQGLITGVQISDRVPPAPGTPYAPMFGRLLPGEGELPLVEWLTVILRRDPALTVGVEVFSEELVALTPEKAAGRVATTTRGVLSRVQRSLSALSH